MQNLALYLVGVLIVIGALAYGAMRLGVPQVWVIIGALVIAGLGIMAAVSKTQRPQ